MRRPTRSNFNKCDGQASTYFWTYSEQCHHIWSLSKLLMSRTERLHCTLVAAACLCYSYSKYDTEESEPITHFYSLTQHTTNKTWRGLNVCISMDMSSAHGEAAGAAVRETFTLTSLHLCLSTCFHDDHKWEQWAQSSSWSVCCCPPEEKQTGRRANLTFLFSFQHWWPSSTFSDGVRYFLNW